MNAKLQDLLSIAKKGNPSKSFHAKSFLKNEGRLIIYGHGAGFIPVKNAILDRLGLMPKYILDGKYQGKNTFDEAMQVPCISMQDFLKLDEDATKYDVIISVGSHGAYLSIKEELQNIGFINIIWAPDIYEFNIHHATGDFDKDPKLIYDQSIDIQNAFELLADDESKETFLALLGIYISHQPTRVSCRQISKQYFPEDIFSKENYRNFIHCGAYVGDSIRNLVTNVGKIDKLICIEPDPESFMSLVSYCKDSGSQISNEITLLPVALGCRHESLRFKANLGLCSEVSDNNLGDFIQSTTLDNLLPTFPVTYISMDLEGFENQALKGGWDLIRLNRPSLAISIYHRIKDLWQILLSVNSLGLGYKFYIRNYTGFTYETILYCKR